MKSKVSMNALEQAVMDKLLWGDDALLNELRVQFVKATIKKRELTEAGFYLTFSLSEYTSKLTDNINNIKSDFCFGDVGAKVENLKNGAGFLIWIRDGKLNMLEGYSYEEAWPESIGEFQLAYFSETRDISVLRQQWLISPPDSGNA